MSTGISEVVTPGGAKAGGNAPSAAVAVPPGGAIAGGRAPSFVIGPALLYIIEVPATPHPHEAADHDDPVAYGVELGLVLAFLFIGGKIVAERAFRLADR